MTITAYSFGAITIDGAKYMADLIILPSGILPGWWRKEGHKLCSEDIKAALVERPQVLIVGTGAAGMMRVMAEVKKNLSDLGIELIEEKTAEACKTFNRVFSKQKTAAALHLTC